jgi:hypothetical protein
MLTLLPKGVTNKIMETFLIKDFFLLPPVSGVVPLAANIFANFRNNSKRPLGILKS